MNAPAVPRPSSIRRRRPLATVLIGTALDEGSDAVVRTGLQVARAAGARVRLVHACPTAAFAVGPGSLLGPDFMERELARCREELRVQVERLGIPAAELAEAAVVPGIPHFVLADAARTGAADLIVLGATGSGPFAAELLGSTAERVLRKAPCPVLVVRDGMGVPPRRVLAPVDLSPLAGDALRCGLDLLEQLGAGTETEVRAVFAQSFLDVLALQHAAGVPSSQVGSYAAAELRRVAEAGRPEPAFRIGTAVLPGDARFEILRELRERPYDLVVLGSHGRGGLDRLVLGSVAATVAREAPCSVLMISSETALGQGIADAVADQTMTTPDERFVLSS